MLAKIRTIRPFLEGSLTTTLKKCGNKKCRCAREGPIHQTALLTWKEHNKTHTLYVPKILRQEVQEWIQEGRILKRLAHQMAEEQRKLLIVKRKTSRSS